MITQNDVDRINEVLYPEGRIYWVDGKGWTSDVWKRLYNEGWRTVKSLGGYIHVIDDSGDIISGYNNNRVQMLRELAVLMR